MMAKTRPETTMVEMVWSAATGYSRRDHEVLTQGVTRRMVSRDDVPAMLRQGWTIAEPEKET